MPFVVLLVTSLLLAVLVVRHTAHKRCSWKLYDACSPTIVGLSGLLVGLLIAQAIGGPS